MKPMSTIFWLLLALTGGYLVLVALLYLFQSKMMYHPVKTIYQTPESVGMAYQTVSFNAEDGTQLSGWFVTSERNRGTIIFSHGNAGNISGRLETIRILQGLGLNVLIYDYRGYGNSEGRPGEEGTYSDVMGAWQYLVKERRVPPDDIILMGRSLGGPVSAWLATRTNPAGLILESTFTSAQDLASELYPFFPVRWLMKYHYPTLEYLKKISIPLLITHSTEDGLVPYHHGRELYEAAAEPKEFFSMQGDHGRGHVESGRAYIEALEKFISIAIQP